MKISKAKIFIIISFITISLGIFWSRHYIYKTISSLLKQDKTIWMNIFVHGTVGSTLGFLDFNAVTGDKIDETIYRKTVLSMRKNNFFYQDQPILERGLKQIKPNLEYNTQTEVNPAAFPIIAGFDIISQLVNPEKSESLFYLFGWSGLLSQKYRRAESLRFYNALSCEIQNLKKNGFNPKVRIIAHSHGGNISLNLAGINHEIHQKNDFYKDFSWGKYVQDAFKKLISRLSSKEVLSKKCGQKQMDYIPEQTAFHVDELIMLGTPIQVETSLFAFSTFFHKVFQLYSEEDMIQSMDFASSITGKSDQKIILKDIAKSNINGQLIQAKLVSDTNQNCKKPKNPTEGKTPFWKVLLGLKSAERKTLNPTHKELWFIIKESKKHECPTLRPVPIVCLLPAILKVLAVSKNQDMDIEIFFENNHLSIKSYSQDKEEAEHSILVPLEVIDLLKKKMQDWAHLDVGSKKSKMIMENLISAKEAARANV